MASKHQVEADAKGHFAPSQADPKADGVASAKPTVVTGSEDATANKWRPDQKKPPHDWELGFDESEPRKDQ
jgi:hypothetical protein